MPNLSTTQFRQLVETAGSANRAADLGQDVTHAISPSSPIDLSGVPALVGDNVTVDVSGAHDFTSGPIFKSVGSRTQIATDVSPDAGDATIKVGTGHNITPGDSLIIASNEYHDSGATSSNNRSYYNGERVEIEEYYDPGTGNIDTVRVSPHIHFTYTPGNTNPDGDTTTNRVYLLNEQELLIEKGITVVGSVGSQQRGLLLDQVDAEINCAFQNVTERCVAAVRSSLHFGGRIGSVSDGTNPTTRYGVHCAGFTDLRVDSAEIYAGRHAVTQASGGFSTLDLADGSSSNTSAGYSSRVTVSGGTYANFSQGDSHKLSAIDSHGTTLQYSVTGANIYGGISVAADYATISGNYIEAHNFRGVYVTGDVVASDKDWCSLTINGNTFRTVGSSGNVPTAPFLESGRDPDFDGDEGMRSLVVTGNTMIGDYYTSGTKPLALRLPVRDGIVFSGNTMKVSYTGESFPGQTQCLVELWSDIDLKNNTIIGTEWELQPWDSAIDIDCSGTTVKDSFRRGLRIDGVDTDPDTGDPVSNEIDLLRLNGVRVTGCSRQGVSVRNANRVWAGSANIYNNGTDTSGADNQRSNLELKDVDSFVSGDSGYTAASADTNQAIYIEHTGNTWTPSKTTLRLSNIDVRTTSSGDNIDDSGATVSYDVRVNIETDNPETLTDLLYRPDIADVSKDANANGEIRRNGSTVSLYAGSKFEVRNAGDGQVSIVGDTNNNQSGTQEWAWRTVASSSNFILRDITAGQTRVVIDGSGNAGFGGVTNPQYPIDVDGRTRVQGPLEVDDTGDANVILGSANHEYTIKVDDNNDRLSIFDGGALIAEFRDAVTGGGFEAQGGIAMFDAGTPNQTSLTAKDTSTVDGTYGTEEEGVIKNNRTRIDEIEVALKDMGLLN